MFTGLRKHLLSLGLCTGLAMVPACSDAQPICRNEYATLDYCGPAAQNAVARLAARIESGDLRLNYQGNRGYLDSLLEALSIPLSSQVLVFSPTSLQRDLISRAAPRALYFSEDTYVGWVQGSGIIELLTIDAERGIVFYNLDNRPDAAPDVVRETRSCLICHDSAALLGGGVPRLLARSVLYDEAGTKVHDFSGAGNINDRTPLEQRWGGWYVSGRHGSQRHLGNLTLRNPAQLRELEELTHGNLDSLANTGLFDTAPYPRATSDIVALLVLEHQLTMQNEIIYVKFKAPAVLERSGYEEAMHAENWGALPAKGRRRLAGMLDRLVNALLFVDAVTWEHEISGSAEFAAWFQSQGPRDGQGKSLRELDLNTRLFTYPLSYLIVSKGFNSLPPYAKDYVYRRLTAIVGGRDDTVPMGRWPEAQRQAALAILRDISIDFAAYPEG